MGARAQRVQDALRRRAGALSRRLAYAPRARRRAPFLVIHGESDTLVPVADARRFVAELRRASESQVLYAELAGAEHAFDIVPSVRTARVVETIERFLATIRAEASNAARLQAIG